MHIAFLNPQGNFDRNDSYWTEHPDFGGQLVYVKNVAIAMAALGHDVDIVTRRIDDRDWPEFAAPFDAYPGHDRVRIVRVGGGTFLRKEDLWPHLAAWADAVRAFYGDSPPDAITGHYGDGGLAASLLAEATTRPFTFTAHSLGAQKLEKLLASGDDARRLDEHYLFRRRLAAERTAIANAAAVITSTDQERREQYGHPAYSDVAGHGRFAVVPPGVALDVFDRDVESPGEAASVDHVRRRMADQIDHERLDLPVVVASSRLDPKKNPAVLVDAFADPELRARANLVFVTGAIADPLHDDGGAGVTERTVLADIRSKVAAHGLTGAVAGIGLRGQAALAAAYRHFGRHGGVFALTALYEPFGLAPLEAAASGLAVVATANGGPSESLADGEHRYGVLVDPTDPEAVASGLVHALDHQAELAEAGRRRVHDRYTWDRTAAGYLDALAAPPSVDPSPPHPYFRGGDDVTFAEMADWMGWEPPRP